MSKMTCEASTIFEILLFDKDRSNIPDEDCAICLNKLKDKGEFGCGCGSYSRKFKKCTHWFHVGCFIHSINGGNKLGDIKCPLCRAALI